jgi:hypothetical protein
MMKYTNKIFLSVILTTLIILSLNSVPILISSQEESLHKTGDFLKLSHQHSDTWTDSQFVEIKLTNGTLIHYEDRFFSNVFNGNGKSTLFALGEEYNFLLDYYFGDCIECEEEFNLMENFEQTIFFLTGIMNITEDFYYMEESYNIGRADDPYYENGWNNFTDTDQRGPFGHQIEEIFIAGSNDTYSIIPDEMYYTTGSFNESFYFDPINEPIDVLMNVFTSLGGYNGDFEINGVVQNIDVTNFTVNVNGYTEMNFSTDITLGEDGDPNAPIIQVEGTIILNFNFYFDIGYDSSNGQFLYFNQHRDGTVNIDMWNNEFLLEIEPGNFVNASFIGSFSHTDDNSEIVEVEGLGEAPGSIGIGPLVKGDQLTFDTKSGSYINYYQESGHEGEDYWYQERTMNQNSDGNATLSVYWDGNDRFGSVIYGFEDVSYEEFYEEGNSFDGPVWTDSWNEYYNHVFVNVMPFMPYGEDNRQLGWHFPLNKFVDTRDQDGKGLWFIWEIPGINNNIPQTELTYRNESGSLNINGYEYNLTGELIKAIYSKNASGSVILNSSDTFYQILNEYHYLENLNITEILVNYDIFIEMIEEVGYDPNTGAFVFHGEEMYVQANISVTAHSYEISLSDASTWYWLINFNLDHYNELLLSGSSVHYLEPQITSDPANETTTDSGNETTTDDTTVPGNETTSESTSDTDNDIQTPINPLPGFEILIVVSSLIVVNLYLKRRKS